jgi:hypothetical protein
MKQITFLIMALLLTYCSNESEMQAQGGNSGTTMTEKICITIGGTTQSATLISNAATQALVEKLQQGSITITLSDGGFEIWGSLGFSLPTSNQQISAQPGDVILYGGSNLCLFYGTNSWSYTRLGKIDGLSGSELRTFLKAGESQVKVTLSLGNNATAIKQVSTNGMEVKDEYYSLNGLRVESPSHGIYIKNGKKVKL